MGKLSIRTAEHGQVGEQPANSTDACVCSLFILNNSDCIHFHCTCDVEAGSDKSKSLLTSLHRQGGGEREIIQPKDVMEGSS
eukprot:1158025-Pelagomonas_calceolata.AAC.4